MAVGDGFCGRGSVRGELNCGIIRTKKRDKKIEMATSSITANFYTDDAKAVNAFVKYLSAPTSLPKRTAVHAETLSDPKDVRSFFRRVRRTAR